MPAPGVRPAARRGARGAARSPPAWTRCAARSSKAPSSALLVAAALGVEFYYTERVVAADDGLGGDVVPGGLPAARGRCARASAASAWRSSTTSSVPARRSVARSRTCSRAARTPSRWHRSPFSDRPRPQFATLNNLALENLGTFPFTLWTPTECPLCQAGVAVQQTAPETAPASPDSCGRRSSGAARSRSRRRCSWRAITAHAIRTRRCTRDCRANWRRSRRHAGSRRSGAARGISTGSSASTQSGSCCRRSS